MKFKSGKKKPDFSVLKKTLAQTKNNLDGATYQTIQQIIEKLMQLQSVDAEEKAQIQGDITNVSNETITIIEGVSTSSYLTTNDETADLPNSVRLAAGTGITFDDSIPHIRTINSTGSGSGYYEPVTNGDPISPEILFDGNGEVIMKFVPL